MQSIDSQPATKNTQVNLGTRIMNIAYWIYEHTLDYPIVEDSPKNFSKLRKKIEEDRKNFRMFSSH